MELDRPYVRPRLCPVGGGRECRALVGPKPCPPSASCVVACDSHGLVDHVTGHVGAAVTALRKATGEGTGDAYLGMLYPTEDYRVFG